MSVNVAPSDIRVKRIPVDLVQLRQRITRRRLTRIAGPNDQAPPGWKKLVRCYAEVILRHLHVRRIVHIEAVRWEEFVAKSPVSGGRLLISRRAKGGR